MLMTGHDQSQLGTDYPWPIAQKHRNSRVKIVVSISRPKNGGAQRMHDAESKTQSSSKRRPPGAAILGGPWGTRRGLSLVSVIVPAYNAAGTVERTVTSALNQTYSNLEVLVVDDGSQDETAAVVRRIANKDHRIKLLQKPNGGLVSARNHGIAHAQGEFIAPLDADDLWHPDKLRRQVAAMRDEVGLVYCWSRTIDRQDRVLFDLAPCMLRGNVYAALIIKNFLHSGAPLVRRSCIDRVGGYDATLATRGADCCEDLKFNLDVAERYDFEVVPEFLSAYRLHPGTMSRNLDAMLRSHEIVVADVQARHPELPDKLFRWANAHQHLEFGLVHLGEGHLLLGLRLLFAALLGDPIDTLRFGALRIYSRFARLGVVARLSSVSGPSSGMASRNFVDTDPLVPCGPARAPWTKSRLAYLNSLLVERGGHQPDRERETPGRNQAHALSTCRQTAG
jgi:glycosyltransferase involved in cell wall biosynthesis